MLLLKANILSECSLKQLLTAERTIMTGAQSGPAVYTCETAVVLIAVRYQSRGALIRSALE